MSKVIVPDKTLWVPTRNIWVPKRSLRGMKDCRGFISTGMIGAIAGSRRRSGGGETLLYDGFSSGTGTFSVGRGSTYVFCGMNNFVPSANSTVTRMEFKLSAVWSVPATMNAKTFTAGMFTISSTYNNDTAVGTSDTVNAVYTWVNEVVSFTFSTPFSITNGTHYNVSVQATTAADPGNYLNMDYTNPGVISGALDNWNASGVSQYMNTFGGSVGSNINIQVRIYGTTP